MATLNTSIYSVEMLCRNALIVDICPAYLSMDSVIKDTHSNKKERKREREREIVFSNEIIYTKEIDS